MPCTGVGVPDDPVSFAEHGLLNRRLLNAFGFRDVDGQDPELTPHVPSLVFSTSLTSSITMFRSTALHMS